jgi:hypothetical protein
MTPVHWQLQLPDLPDDNVPVAVGPAAVGRCHIPGRHVALACSGPLTAQEAKDVAAYLIAYAHEAEQQEVEAVRELADVILVASRPYTGTEPQLARAREAARAVIAAGWKRAES